MKIPKMQRKNKPQINKMQYIYLVWIIAIVTIVTMAKSIGPMFNEMCIAKAKEISTRILNIESSEVLKDIDYNDLIIVEKDVNQSVRVVRSNIILINLLASDIVYNVQNKLSELGREAVKIPLGTLTGSKILSGIGPNVSIQIVPVGSVEAEFYSDFEAMGVNQTIHRLYLVINCEVKIVTAYNVINTNIENQVLFAENIIIGEVPDTYYNLEGIEKENVMEVLN